MKMSFSLFRFPRYFVGLSVMSRNLNKQYLLDAISAIRNDHSLKLTRRQPNEVFLEIMAHPGHPSVDLKAGCSGLGPDDFAKSEDRLYEKDFLTSTTAFEIFSEIEKLVDD